MSNTDTSKFIALILRHKPEAIGITLDEHGWANVDELIAGINKKQHFDNEYVRMTRATCENKLQAYLGENVILKEINSGLNYKYLHLFFNQDEIIEIVHIFTKTFT